MNRRVRYVPLLAGVAAIAMALSALAPAAASSADDPSGPPPKVMDPPVLVQGVDPDKQQQPMPQDELDSGESGGGYAAAAPATNSFSAASALSGASPLGFGDTTDATVEQYEPTTIEAGNPYLISNTVWFKWTAPASGWITAWVDTDDDDADLVMGIFTGSSMKHATRKAVSDDDYTSAAGGAYTPRITGFKVSKGTSYHFQVGMNNAAPTSFALLIDGKYAAPANDQKADAIAKTASSWSATGTTVGASIEPVFEPVGITGSPSSTLSRFNSVWWKWTPTSAAIMSADTEGSTGDTYLGIFAYSVASGFREVAFSDDGGPAFSAKVTGLQVFGDETYYFQVGHITSTSRPQAPVKITVSTVANGPRITKVSPASGPKAGGTSVTITGARFDGVNQITFGGVQANTFQVVDSTHIVVFSPPGSSGKKYIQVWRPTVHFSRITTSGVFTYK